MSLDSVDTTLKHKRILERNLFLRRVYRDFYSYFVAQSDLTLKGVRLELGSGAGFLKEHLKGVLTSDLIVLDSLDLVCSGLSIPLQDESCAAIYLLNVFHHLPDVRMFLSEAQRCLRKGGQILMIEPTNSALSRFIFKNFHHEPFLPQEETWSLPGDGRLSDANGALPWIVFKRDYDTFRSEFPDLSLESYQNFCSLRYLLSGGFSLPQMIPGWSYSIVHSLESLLERHSSNLGLFAKISLRKR